MKTTDGKKLVVNSRYFTRSGCLVNLLGWSLTVSEDVNIVTYNVLPAFKTSASKGVYRGETDQVSELFLYLPGALIINKKKAKKAEKVLALNAVIKELQDTVVDLNASCQGRSSRLDMLIERMRVNGIQLTKAEGKLKAIEDKITSSTASLILLEVICDKGLSDIHLNSILEKMEANL
jgi:hypothetical protein